MSKKRAIELWDTGLIDEFEVGTFKSLSDIHAYLFQDVFDFAGKIRTVNISKGSFRFAPLLFLESNLAIIEKMPEDSFDQIIDKYVEMNEKARHTGPHPFREGNSKEVFMKGIDRSYLYEDLYDISIIEIDKEKYD